jgi:hypothetical protein
MTELKYLKPLTDKNAQLVTTCQNQCGKKKRAQC